jgi:SWI/SNF-related matrix-associated actin-dependent regulator 1 of chromatin subfamily A
MTITITKEGARYVARFAFSYAVKDAVKAAGFRFDAPRKLWFTEKQALGEALMGNWSLAAFVARVNDSRDVERQAQEASIVASRAAESTLQIPLSAECKRRGYDFFPFQKAGVEYALARPGTLFGCEMGLGKTMQAIGVINVDETVKTVLVICKASLKLNWLREARLWIARDMRIEITNGIWPADADVVITNYEQVNKYRQHIDSRVWDLLIIDEAHMIKNPKAQRTHAILGSRDAAGIKARRRVFLTGTPILNRPTELWTLVHALDPDGLGRSWKGFHNRYCGPSRGWQGRTDYSGASHLDELQGRLRASIMVRRMKADVLKELPAKRRAVITLQVQSEQERNAIAEESRVVRESESRVAAMRAEVERLSVDQAGAAYEQAVHNLRQAEAIAFTETSRVRHEVALAKLPRVIEHVRDCLEEAEGKIVVFVHHHDVGDGIADALDEFNPLQADGRDSNAGRQSCVDAFQNDPKRRVIICGMQSMAEGHTLTASSHVVFAELDWVPGKLAQAEDRCHRIGQTDSVLVQHIVLDGSLDGRMAELIVEKMEVIAAAIDWGEVLPEVAHLAAPIEPVMAEIKEQIMAVNEPEVFAPEPGLISSDVVDLIHHAMKCLAERCDGAQALDGNGFNKLDARFGHDIAARASLTQKQARAAAKLVVKYGRQLDGNLVDAVRTATRA